MTATLDSRRRAAAWAFLGDLPPGGTVRILGEAPGRLGSAFTELGFRHLHRTVSDPPAMLLAAAPSLADSLAREALGAGAPASMLLLPSGIHVPRPRRPGGAAAWVLRSSGAWHQPTMLDAELPAGLRRVRDRLRGTLRGWCIATGPRGLNRLEADVRRALDLEAEPAIRRILLQRRGSVLLDVLLPDGGTREILRLVPLAEEAGMLGRRRGVLDQLLSDPRLSRSVTSLIPAPLGEVSVRGAAGLHMEARAGRAGHRLPTASRLELRRDVTRFVRRLTEAMPRPTDIGEVELERLVGRHLAAYRGAHRGERLEAPLALLDRVLRSALSGRRLPLAPVHGDLDETNVLADAATGRLSAVVDWECADLADLPGTDLAYYQLALDWPPAPGALAAALHTMLHRLEDRMEFGPGLDAAWLRRLGLTAADLACVATLAALRITAQDLAYRGSPPELVPREVEDVRDIAAVIGERLGR